jgi:hypothetical protein
LEHWSIWQSKPPLNKSAWPEDTPLSQRGQLIFTCVDRFIYTRQKFGSLDGLIIYSTLRSKAKPVIDSSSKKKRPEAQQRLL